MTEAVPLTDAERSLREHQIQIDEDGIMCGVSRQALHEVLAELAALREKLTRAREALEPWALWAQDQLDNQLPASILRSPETPVLGRAFGEGGMIGEVTVGDLRKAAEVHALLSTVEKP